MKKLGDACSNVVNLHCASATAESAVTRQHRRLFAAHDNISIHPPNGDEISFLGRHLVQLTLPYKSPPKSLPVWKRTDGNVTLRIRQGLDKNDEPLGYPSGTIPRLLLYWMTREAMQKGRRLELGGTLAGFMRELGLDPGRSDAYRLRQQMHRLFKATIMWEKSDTAAAGVHTEELDMIVAPKRSLWWDPKQPDQPSLWGSWVELSDEFYQSLISNPVPVDLRALRGLKDSALALDLYAWSTWRTWRVTRRGKPQFIPWRALHRQFGTTYKDPREFARYAKREFAKIRLVYPALRIAFDRGGLTLSPSSTAVPSLLD